MKVWIRKNDGAVCEVFYGTDIPKDCEAPGKWSQVESDSKAVVDFNQQIKSLIDKHYQDRAKHAKLMELMLNPDIDFESERKKILAGK